MFDTKHTIVAAPVAAPTTNKDGHKYDLAKVVHGPTDITADHIEQVEAARRIAEFHSECRSQQSKRKQAAAVPGTAVTAVEARAAAPLSRFGYLGPETYAPQTVAAAAEYKTADVRAALSDMAYVLPVAYRPGAEKVSLVTWAVWGENGDLRPLVGTDVYAAEDLCLIRAGYTGKVLRRAKAQIQQAVMVLYRVKWVDDAGQAEPTESFTLVDCPDAISAPMSADVFPVKSVYASYVAYNLVDTVRRFADPARAAHGTEYTDGLGPLAVTVVKGKCAVVQSLAPDYPDNVPGFVFWHNGPISNDHHDVEPAFGVHPWSVVAGCVTDHNTQEGGFVFGQVRVTARE